MEEDHHHHDEDEPHDHADEPAPATKEEQHDHEANDMGGNATWSYDPVHVEYKEAACVLAAGVSLVALTTLV